jgi:hypothetical protein
MLNYCPVATDKASDILHTGGTEMPHCGIGAWEIAGFAAKRATTSYGRRITAVCIIDDSRRQKITRTNF